MPDADAPPPPPGVGTTPAVEDPSRLPAGSGPLLTAVFLSYFSVSLLVTAAGIQAFAITGGTLALGLLGLAEFVPNLLLAPVVGAVADRYDRRRVAAVGLAIEALSAVGLYLYALTEPTSVGPVLAIVVVYGVGRAVVAPAMRAMPADIAGAGQLTRLVPRQSAAFQLAQVAGPGSAGLLYSVGVPVPFAASAVVAVAAAGVVTLVPRPRTERGPQAESGRELVRAAWEGVRFVRRTPILLGAIALDLFAVLFGGAVALIPAIGEQRLGVGEVGVGWLRAAVGVGAGLTTLALATRPVRAQVGRVLLAAVAAFGVLTIVFGATTNYAVAFVALLGLAAADAVSVIIRSTLVPLVTPSLMRGRVLAVENVFIGASNELGAFESGVVGQVVGAPAAVVSGGVAVLVVVAVWWRRFPALRDFDRFTPAAVVVPAPTPGAGP